MAPNPIQLTLSSGLAANGTIHVAEVALVNEEGPFILESYELLALVGIFAMSVCMLLPCCCYALNRTDTVRAWRHCRRLTATAAVDDPEERQGRTLAASTSRLSVSEETAPIIGEAEDEEDVGETTEAELNPSSSAGAIKQPEEEQEVTELGGKSTALDSIPSSRLTAGCCMAGWLAMSPLIGLVIIFLWGYGWNPQLHPGDRGLLQVYSIAVCGEAAAILAPTQPRRRLEVIGDSDTAGFAIEHASPSSVGELDCVFHGRQSTNAKKAWAALVGERLDVDVMTVAASGIGLARNALGLTFPAPMPGLYNRPLPFVAPGGTRWNASGWTPDGVVIFLGSNDMRGGLPPGKEGFVAELVRFMDTVRAQYDPPPIMMTFCAGSGGPEQMAVCPYMPEAVAQFNTLHGDGAAHAFELEAAVWEGLLRPANTTAMTTCLGHWTPRAHRLVAGDAAPRIARALGWVGGGPPG